MYSSAEAGAASGLQLQCVHAYEAAAPGQLSLAPGDIVHLLPADPLTANEFWRRGYNVRTQRQGLFPADHYCVPLDLPTLASAARAKASVPLLNLSQSPHSSAPLSDDSRPPSAPASPLRKPSDRDSCFSDSVSSFSLSSFTAPPPPPAHPAPKPPAYSDVLQPAVNPTVIAAATTVPAASPASDPNVRQSAVPRHLPGLARLFDRSTGLLATVSDDGVSLSTLSDDDSEDNASRTSSGGFESMFLQRESARVQKRKAMLQTMNLEARRVFLEKSDSGYGFAINGESPVFVRSVVPGGPADKGLRGLLEGDIILKVNRTPCPLGPRSLVVDLIRATPADEDLVLVVCRTPMLPRRPLPATGMRLTSFDDADAENNDICNNVNERNGVRPFSLSDGRRESQVEFCFDPDEAVHSAAQSAPESPAVQHQPAAHVLSEKALEVPPPPAYSLQQPPPELTGAASAGVAVAAVTAPLQLRSESPPSSTAGRPLSLLSSSSKPSPAQEAAMQHFYQARRLKDVGTTDFSGWLSKLCGASSLGQRWRQRYFVLCGCYLAYYRHSQGSAQPCLKTNLFEAVVEPASTDARNLTLCVKPRHSKLFYIRAKSKAIYDAWIERLLVAASIEAPEPGSLDSSLAESGLDDGDRDSRSDGRSQRSSSSLSVSELAPAVPPPPLLEEGRVSIDEEAMIRPVRSGSAAAARSLSSPAPQLLLTDLERHEAQAHLQQGSMLSTFSHGDEEAVDNDASLPGWLLSPPPPPQFAVEGGDGEDDADRTVTNVGSLTLTDGHDGHGKEAEGEEEFAETDM